MRCGGGCRGEDVGGYGGAAGAKASAREGNGGASKEDERDLERERKPGGSGGPGGGKWGDGGRKRNVRAFLRRRRRRRRRRVVGARRPAAGAAGVKKWAGVSEKRGVGGVFNNDLERSEDGRLGGRRRARERLGAGEDAIREEEEEEEEEGEKAPREGKRPEEPTCFSEHGKAQEHKGVVCSVLCVVVGSKTQKKRGRGFSQSVGPRGLSSCASPLSSRHPSQEGAVDEGREGGGGGKGTLEVRAAIKVEKRRGRPCLIKSGSKRQRRKGAQAAGKGNVDGRKSSAPDGRRRRQ